MPTLSRGVHLCSWEEKEVFEVSIKLLFIIKPQQDFMIIFITSSFKTLGALKVNNPVYQNSPSRNLGSFVDII